MKRKGLRALGILIVALCMSLAGAAMAAETINVEGTGASQDMLREIAASFMRANPGVKVEVPDSIGSGGGVKAAGEGRAHLGRVARKIKEKEKGYGLEYLAFARMPLVFVAHPSVKGVSNLTTAQTVDIYSGRITNWKEVGGPDEKIRVVTRYEGDSTYKLLKSSLTGWNELQITPKSKSTETDQENIELLGSTENTIGYATMDIAMNAGLRVLSLDGVAPTDDRYPMAIEFGLVYKPEKMTGKTKEFVEFLFSKNAVDIIRNSAGMPVSGSEVKVSQR